MSATSADRDDPMLAIPAPPPFLAAAVQMDIALGDRAGNLRRIEERARAAAREGARLIVFPECAVTGYCIESRSEARGLAEPLPGPSTEHVARVAAELDVFVIFGLIERDGDRLFNALALVGPRGLAGTYRKIHLPDIGLDRVIDRGDRPFAVHDLPIGRIGMSICYDGGFPESARILALLGADLVCLPTNWPRGAEEFARHAVPTRGLENTIYYLAADRIGEERGTRFIGLSSIVDVHGRVIAAAGGDGEAILLGEIDPARAREKRIVRVPGKHTIDRIGDRRPELYGPLVERRSEG